MKFLGHTILLFSAFYATRVCIYIYIFIHFIVSFSYKLRTTNLARLKNSVFWKNTLGSRRVGRKGRIKQGGVNERARRVLQTPVVVSCIFIVKVRCYSRLARSMRCKHFPKK